MERFSRKLWCDWLAQEMFASAADLYDATTRWLWTYNDEWPNMAFSGITLTQRLTHVA